MADQHRRLAAENAPAHHDEVESLASQVLSALAHRSGLCAQTVDEDVLSHFCADLLRGGKSIRTDSVSDLRRRGLNAGTILECYIPAAARELGERWSRDELSFADVTIGTARLQAMLREMGEPWGVDCMQGRETPNIMLIVPIEEFHTLGGMTAASQLRRLGLSVCLCVGQTEEEILQKVATRQFDMIALSLSCRQKIIGARALIDNMRKVAPGPVPIVIGGRVVDGTQDLCALTGADHATSDPKEALRLCGLQAPVQTAPDGAVRG
ncbi:methanogenic corrinoid protein MtbC1 [Rhodovulum bhavnagarense]|uniref:Methanogenic corrinoid protein MtbC1 n=1 Tax=Rhodovulum bhavnagarense TaxID=992286 RepID=A0A4V2SVW0_9RHOB|nr:cobalamin B12-binding domain-containing protein [Rhodovulum bhavnagarense]TCP59946.1 methanogenic corrinoid protein MtbC1 [Rhodovulum bhavnagarense]